MLDGLSKCRLSLLIFIPFLYLAQLEAALGTFYAPVKPLTEVTVLEYRDPISRLARRFFHHLLRYTRFDKAFLLAVDIGARDLFMVTCHILC